MHDCALSRRARGDLQWTKLERMILKVSSPRDSFHSATCGHGDKAARVPIKTERLVASPADTLFFLERRIVLRNVTCKAENWLCFVLSTFLEAPLHGPPSSTSASGSDLGDTNWTQVGSVPQKMLSVYVLVPGGVAVVVVYLMFHRLTRSTRGTTVQDKVVMVTGASSGLGEACAEVFFRAGAKVILSSRSSEKLQATSERLQNLNIPGVTYPPVVLPLDLEDLDSLHDKAQQAVQCHGRVDILINNAGLSYRGTCLDTTAAAHQKVMNINYLGTITLTRGILQHMVQQGGGHIVNISSIQGRIAIPYRSAYTAAKHALQAYSDTLRAEMASSGVRVMVVSPSYIRTQLSVNAITSDASQYGAMDSTTAIGMAPEFVAHRILQAVEKGDSELILGTFIERAAITLRCIAPSLYFAIMKSRAKKLEHNYVHPKQS